MNSRLRLISPFALFLTMNACSLLGPQNQTVTIVSDPNQARVELNGEYIGDTPLNHSVRRNLDIIIKLTKEGYETAFLKTKSVPSTFGIIDIFGGGIFLFPFLGFVSPAAWKYDPSSFGAILIPVTKD